MVTGVYKDYPSNSHFKPKYIINVNAMRNIYGNDFNDYMEGTAFDQSTSVFFRIISYLKPGANIKPINAALNTMANANDASQIPLPGKRMSRFLAFHDQNDGPPFRQKKSYGNTNAQWR